PLAARGRRTRAARRGGAVGGARGDAVDRPPVDARADPKALARAATGAHPEVRVQLSERRRREDPRQDRGRDQVAATSGARVPAEADHPELMALEVGLVGLPSSGKSMLFEALTGARASGEV